MVVVNQQATGFTRLRAAWLRRPVLYSLAAILGAMFLAAALQSGMLPGQNALNGANPAEDLLEILTGRSPGERTKAELRNSKPKPSSPVARGPHLPRQERVLGKVFPPESPPYPTPEQLLAFNRPLLGPLELPSGGIPGVSGSPQANFSGSPLFAPLLGGASG